VRGRVAILAGVILLAAGAAFVGGLSPAPRPAPAVREPTNAPPASPASPVPATPAAEQWSTVRWTRLEEPLFDVQDFNLRVATDGSRIAVLGETAIGGEAGEAGRPTVSVLWTSNDALTWRRHEVQGPPGEVFRLASVTVVPSGYMGIASSATSLDVATSPDGERWMVLGRWPEEAWGPIIPSAEGFVTAGLRDGKPVVFVSADGAAWRPIPGPAEAGKYAISRVRPTSDGLVIAGAFGDVGNWDGLIWRWTVGGGLVDVVGRQPAFVGPDRSVRIHQAVPHAGGVYVQGSVEQPAPAQCGMGGSRMAAVGPIVADVCGRTDLAWASSDWVRWQEVERPPPADPDVIAAGGAGLVALVDEGPVETGLWTSRDGMQWRRLGDGIADPRYLIVLPGRLVAIQGVGHEMGVAVWVGTAGG
jgi:hypothetical protein